MQLRFYEVVLPDGTGSDNRRPGKRRAGIFIVAALAIVVGFVSLGTLTSPDTAAVEETATTSTTVEEVEPPVDTDAFTVEQIARGEPFEWSEVIFLEDAYPIALFDHQESIYLFVTARPSFTGFEEGGLRGWRTADGRSWEPLGQVIPENRVVTHVSSTGQGIVALESRDGGAELAVWQSDDGIDWGVEEVSPQDLDPWTRIVATAVGGTDDILVVTSHAGVNIHERVQEELRSRGGEDLDLPGVGFGVEVIGGDVTFPLYGPLGFPLAVLTPEELDFSTEELQAIVDDYQGRNPRTIVWSKTEDAGWQQAEVLDAFSIETISPTPDGDLVALGYGSTGFTSWSSSDGVNWEETQVPKGPSRIDKWQGRLVGPSDMGRAEVLVSGDEGSWEDIGPGEHFPNEFDWSINAVGAGLGGVAAMATGWDRSGRLAEIVPDDPPKLTSDDATLTLDPGSGSYSLETRDGTIHEWSMNSSSAPEGVTGDLARGAIDFHDPDTEEHLASFPIDGIAEAQDSFWGGRSVTDAHQAFAFTSDGTEWTIQDLLATCPHSGWCRIFGDSTLVTHLEVTGSHVVLVAIRETGQFSADPSPGFVVWSAPIP